MAVAEMLPDAMGKAIESYQQLAEKPDLEKDPKVHQLHQTACKAALQHIELLMKLAAASDTSQTSLPQTDFTALMKKAGDELSAYQANSPDADKKKGASK